MQTYTSLSTREERIGRQSSDMVLRQMSSAADDALPPGIDEEDADLHSGSSQLASWLFSAPNDILRMNVEKRYADGVALVIRCRAYVASAIDLLRTDAGGLTSEGLRAENALNAIESEVPNLANGILRSLAKLPISPVSLSAQSM